MKTQAEQHFLSLEYLSIIRQCYDSDDFLPLRAFLAESCVLEAPDSPVPHKGRDAVIRYLTDDRKTKSAEDVCACYAQEIVCGPLTENSTDPRIGKRTHALPARYAAGDFGMYIEHTVGETAAGTLLCLKTDDKDKIIRIDLFGSERLDLRDFGNSVDLVPANGKKSLKKGKITVSESYLSAFYLFFSIIGEQFSEYFDLSVPMHRWLQFLDVWRRFYAFRSFDDAFEDACGIDYKNFTVKNRKTLDNLQYSGLPVWENRRLNPYLLPDLIEWTEKYKNTCDTVHIYGY